MMLSPPKQIAMSAPSEGNNLSSQTQSAEDVDRLLAMLRKVLLSTVEQNIASAEEPQMLPADLSECNIHFDVVTYNLEIS